MSLILAVEPDGRQAAHVKVLAGKRLQAELVIGETAALALEALGRRVPDLVLTSPLLSWHDEAALSARLRDLGNAAAHVQTLTIPILASPLPAPRKRGMLSKLRKKTTSSETGGCDPDIFAEQVRLYLEQAVAQRGEAAEPIDDVEELIEPPFVEAAADMAIEEPIALSQIDLAPTIEESVAPTFVELAPTIEDEIAPTFVELPPTIEAPIAVAADDPWVPIPLEELYDAIVLSAGPAEIPQAEDVWVLEPVIIADVPFLTLAPEPVPVAALPEPVPVAAAPEPPPVAPVRRKQPAKPKKKPVQDEWGFFDPDQCGFAALVAKLDEITDADAAAAADSDTSVRVIAY